MSARDILGLANELRESGKFLESLQTSDQALVEFFNEKDLAGISETLASRFLTLKHLYRKSEDKNYLIIAKAEMIASVDIAKSSDVKSAKVIPLFNLAKVYDELDELRNAIPVYKEAILAFENNPPKTHNRPGVLADFRIHLATAELKSGDTSAQQRLEQALSDLEKTDEPSFNKNVWTSGAHMNLAHLLRINDLETAKFHLQKAKEIIDSDKRLVLRKNQWEKLAETFE